MTTKDSETIQSMREYGGGFVKSLAEAAMRADVDNLRRIKEAWPEYWEMYSPMSNVQDLPQKKSTKL